jgi:hypothetical protein
MVGMLAVADTSSVLVAEAVGRTVLVADAVEVGVRVLVGVLVKVKVGLGMSVLDAVSVGVTVKVAVGCGVSVGVSVGISLGVSEGSTRSVGIAPSSAAGSQAAMKKAHSSSTINRRDAERIMGFYSRGMTVTHRVRQRLGLLMVALMLGACQTVESETFVLPTLMATFPPPEVTYVLPTPRGSRDLPTAPPTLTPTETATPRPTFTALPTLPASTAEPLIMPTRPISAALPSDVPSGDTAQAFTFGTSVEGRALTGLRLGSGSRVLMLVGAVHGGFEVNSIELIEALATHFQANPADLPPDTALVLIPMLNPDGVARGRVLEGRFNANAVDLNRNWPCGWQAEAYFRDQVVSAGSQPLSEPETAALAALIQTLQPSAVLFYHAAASGVFAGNCGGDVGSQALAATVGTAAGYDFGAAFSAYPVTGTAPAWVNSLGIPAADVELASATDPEFERNLAGVLAALDWLTVGN